MYIRMYLCIGKGEAQPRTGHEDPDGEKRYSSTLSFISTLNVGGWSKPNPGRFTPGTEPVPILKGVGWAPELGLEPRTVQPVASRYTTELSRVCVSLCQQGSNYPSCHAGFEVRHRVVSSCQSPANGPTTERFQVRHLVDRVVGLVGWDELLRANKYSLTVPPFLCLSNLVSHVCHTQGQLRNIYFDISSLYHVTKYVTVTSERVAYFLKL